ncbi:eukaryotic translation initiation factor 4E-binding protein 3-like [Tachysurus ichikawai]
MSANTQKTRSCPIPTRVIQLKDWSQLPDCYSQTPGGTLFSTTPGVVIPEIQLSSTPTTTTNGGHQPQQLCYVCKKKNI